MSALYDDASERERFVASVREHGRLEHHRARLRRRDGGMVSVIETVVGEFDAGGALIELRGFLHRRHRQRRGGAGACSSASGSSARCSSTPPTRC